MSEIQIQLIDSTTGAIKYILPPNAVTDFTCNRVLNKIGKFVLTFVNQDDFFNACELDDYIEIYQQNNDGEFIKFETYFIRTKKFIIEDDINYYGLGGVSLNHLIKRRLLDIDVDTQASGGYYTVADYAGNIYEHLATDHMISCSDTSRNFPFLTFSKVDTGTSLVGLRKRYENLLDIFQEIASKSDVDFWIKREGVDDNSLTLYSEIIGTDKTKKTNYPTSPFTKLTPKQGTLKAATLSIDNLKEKNFVYLLGEGDELNQQIIKYSASTVGNSLFNRIEFSVKSRNQKSDFTNVTQQITEAIRELKENQKEITLNYELLDQIASVINISFGDKIDVFWNEESVSVRLTEETLTLENGRIKTDVKLERFEI